MTYGGTEIKERLPWQVHGYIIGETHARNQA